MNPIAIALFSFLCGASVALRLGRPSLIFGACALLWILMDLYPKP